MRVVIGIAMVAGLLGSQACASTIGNAVAQNVPTAGLGRLPTPQTAMRFEVAEASITELQAAMTRGEVTAVELVDAYLRRVNAYDGGGITLNSILYVNPRAKAEAAVLDLERAQRGPRGPLHGIPILLKDNFNTVDMPTTAGSLALAGMRPATDAYQVRRLREAGAIILGKTNLGELAMLVPTNSSLGGQTRNPYDPSRHPGGSSGGTGAGVAASLAAIGWGSDTCGSLGIPASANNLFALRPTKGLSSTSGIVPLSHTQDVAGPLARTVRDLAIGLDATIGPDPADPSTQTRVTQPLPRFVDSLDPTALRGARLGMLTQFFGNATDEQAVGAVVRAAVDKMRTQGAEVVQIAIPGLEELIQETSVIAYEFKWDFIDYLAQTPGAAVHSVDEILERGLYHQDLEPRIRERNRVQARDTEEYRVALAKQNTLRETVLRAFEQHRLQALAYPTLRRGLAPIGEPQVGANCQLSASTGFPTLTIPAGFTDRGFPVGLDLLGKPFGDAQLLALGYSYEQTTNPRRPPALTPPVESPRLSDTVSFGVRGVVASAPTGRSNTAEMRATFVYNALSGSLAFEVAVIGVADEEVHAVALHRGPTGENGPIVRRLLGPRTRVGNGSFDLTPVERRSLLQGDFYLQLYTRDHPTGIARQQLILPVGVGAVR
jgi:Asp-tRNA(Asn)/Glu-tRNA(Gln) amidotransferase A subunit family amidase